MTERMRKRAADIERISYRPATPYAYDLEIFRVSDLKRRTREENMRRVSGTSATCSYA